MSDMTQPQQRRRDQSIRLFFAAGAAVAPSIVLPWTVMSPTGDVSSTSYTTADLSYSTKPTSTGVVILLLVAGTYAWVAWTLREQRSARRRAIRTWICNAVVALFAIVNASHVHDNPSTHVTVGAGLLAVFCALGFGIAATIKMHCSGAQAAPEGQ